LESHSTGSTLHLSHFSKAPTLQSFISGHNHNNKPAVHVPKIITMSVSVRKTNRFPKTCLT